MRAAAARHAWRPWARRRSAAGTLGSPAPPQRAPPLPPRLPAARFPPPCCATNPQNLGVGVPWAAAGPRAPPPGGHPAPLAAQQHSPACRLEGRPWRHHPYNSTPTGHWGCHRAFIACSCGGQEAGHLAGRLAVPHCGGPVCARGCAECGGSRWCVLVGPSGSEITS